MNPEQLNQMIRDIKKAYKYLESLGRLVRMKRRVSYSLRCVLLEDRRYFTCLRVIATSHFRSALTRTRHSLDIIAYLRPSEP